MAEQNDLTTMTVRQNIRPMLSYYPGQNTKGRIMKKKSGKNETIKTEGISNPELLFSDDELVVDYLNALLASAPALKLDSGEIHFVHLSMEAGWKPARAANAIVDNSMIYESEISAMGAEVLKHEIENLKFKSELANIDIQVLRSENDNLKTDITSLTAQLNELKQLLDAMTTENNDLKSRIDPHQNQLSVPLLIAEDSALHLQADSVINSDMVTENVSESDTEPVVSLDDVAFMTNQEEESELELVAAQNILPVEISMGISDDSVIVVQEQSVNDRPFSEIDQDTAIISRPHAAIVRGHQKADHAVVIFSRKSHEAVSSVQSAIPASKVIKQQHVRELHTLQESDRDLRGTLQNPVQHEETIEKSEHQPEFAQLQPEAIREDVSVSNRDAQRLDDTDEADQAPAPAPKVVVLRNVKYYEDLQKESDSANAPKTGHTIVL